MSVDSVESHQAFKQANNLPFPLIADTDRGITKLYGANRRWFSLAPTKRVTYLIDSDGVIRDVLHHELAIDRHRREVLKGLRKLNGA